MGHAEAIVAVIENDFCGGASISYRKARFRIRLEARDFTPLGEVAALSFARSARGQVGLKPNGGAGILLQRDFLHYALC